MGYQQYISEQDAIKYYRSILESCQDNGTLVDKTNRLRSIFDFILRDAIDRKYKGKVPRDRTMGFQVMVDDLFEGDDLGVKSRKENLHKIRGLFNNTQHVYKKGLSIGEFQIYLTNHDYKLCLKCITDLVEFFSGIPVIPELEQAQKELDYKRMKQPLEIVLMIELFDKLEHVEKGLFIKRKVEEMILEKDKIGLDLLTIHLVTYSSYLNCISPIERYSDMKKNEFCSQFVNPLNAALAKGLELLNHSVDNYLSPHGTKYDRPWFVWLCNSLNYSIDDVHLNKLKQFIDSDIVGFYPFALDSDETSLKFEKIIPKCGPKVIDYKLSGNLFISILDTIQSMHSGHKIIKVNKV